MTPGTYYVIERIADGFPMHAQRGVLIFPTPEVAQKELAATTKRIELWEIVPVEVQRKEKTT
jgi:hypothetical protein